VTGSPEERGDKNPNSREGIIVPDCACGHGEGFHRFGWEWETASIRSWTACQVKGCSCEGYDPLRAERIVPSPTRAEGERWTIYVCDKGHVSNNSLDGVCWACCPGGRRTWEPGEPKQTEPNQRKIEVVPASRVTALEAERDEWREAARAEAELVAESQAKLERLREALEPICMDNGVSAGSEDWDRLHDLLARADA
jgi:hypothetical protein